MTSQRIKYLLCFVLASIWLSHLLQVFVPETGFDALWYHLPVVEAIARNGGLIYLPDLYQSVNPLFADLFFLIGFLIAKDFGTKVIAYLFGLFLIFGSYKLARKFISANWSLLLIILISTFQVVAWQSASFYVDVAKAVFEVSSLYFLFNFKRSQTKKDLWLAGLFFSASLATKLFSLFLLPVFLFLVYIFSTQQKKTNLIIFALVSLILPMPFYSFAYFNTGDAFYSFNVHNNKLLEIGGHENKLIYLRETLRYFPLSLPALTLAKDYVSIIFIIFLPLIYFYKKLLTHEKTFPLFFYSIAQYCLWWFLPPQSTRYALSGFITLTIVYFVFFKFVIKKHSSFFWPIIASILLAISINFAPRLIVNLRSLKYLTDQQTKVEYLEQFYDGSIDRNIKEWHFRATL